MPLRRKKFILALQPHELQHSHGMWSPLRKNTLSFYATLILLMGLAFPTTPDVWNEQIRVGLLRLAYGWQTSNLITSSQASSWYSQLTGNVPKTGCKDAPLKDWRVFCPIMSSQMSYGIDCDNANLDGKAEILRNLEKSRTTYQYACLYGV